MKEPVGERPIMPDYGVQDAEDWQALPWSWAAAKLAAARNFWLCTASVTGQPHALPLWGVWDEATHRFCFSCGPRSRKAADVAANPHVAFAPEDTVECVSVEGTAAVIADPRLQYWISLYRAKYGRGVSAAFLRSNLMVEVTPERAYAIIEREPEFSTRATRWRFA